MGDLLKVAENKMPEEFTEDIRRTITRIAKQPGVIGMLFYKNRQVSFCEAPNSLRSLSNNLPKFSENVYRAVKEIDILDDLVAFKIECSSCEITVVGGAMGGEHLGACVIQKVHKKYKKTKVHFEKRH